MECLTIIVMWLVTTVLTIVYVRNLAKRYEWPKKQHPIGFVDKVERDGDGIVIHGRLTDSEVIRMMQDHQAYPSASVGLTDKERRMLLRDQRRPYTGEDNDNSGNYGPNGI